MQTIIAFALKAVTTLLGLVSTLDTTSTWFVYQPKAPKSVLK